MDANEKMIVYLLENKYITPEIALAMKTIKREFFVDKYFRESCYLDLPLSIGFGQTISAPSIVGIMLKELDVKKGMKILEIGTGSGWQTALLSKLVGKEGTVYSIERIEQLEQIAKERFQELKINNILTKVGDGSEGWKEYAPFDRIIVSASTPKIPDPLIEQLSESGKMIIPIGISYWQDLIRVEKSESGEIKIEKLLPVLFVPLVGRFGYPEEGHEKDKQ